MIPVTKPYLPSRDKLNTYIDGIYERGWLTNGGPLQQELTRRLEQYLGVKNLLLVSNGTLALQVAYKALEIGNRSSSITEAITSPFTFVATVSSLKWEGIKPVFGDIDPAGWCLTPDSIKENITPDTEVIVPVHVFGNACDVEEIDKIASQNKLKVVYDASHAFDVRIKGKSILSWGDASTLSFHATKLFHTVEGGAIVFKYESDLKRAQEIINFGLSDPHTISEIGINAKMNEFQAAMGLCVLDEIDENLAARKRIAEYYKTNLTKSIKVQELNESTPNNAYMPILFDDETQVYQLLDRLKNEGILARRYFYPSLNKTIYGSGSSCPESEYVSRRIVCLPIYSELDELSLAKIISIVNTVAEL
ncbi:DegT/DnrJ/EryC1/StrS family aminotransferase [Thalassolituus sp. UBA3500]|jgi:dTDP-4-amino-4,6-dideoxygalactose transaminase|uniref:DegT/DnrJ/EryC1/StrS family aminotransferase n=1 Tax=Thalassolituus sp. UBA3500 TaxID=1947664 RepID=UPI0007CFD650|nr:DegT/DnrJ/EryC1/StrS family aminotransferase [Thalassolituus sp. UBA3500]KZZ12869.1 aminotransferase DegT [Oleibacter sp. HI0075]MBN59276.1 DegT/DnrJ/EryC1/StrS family aminotransferase [Oceanospirillaceae bacterium]|tara:strand:- start:171 stop:1262 length:1092 start_codon:yes stop_codon:yes gene_type:complete